VLSSVVKDNELQAFIGSIPKNESIFLKWSSDISTLFALSFQGRIDEINPEKFVCLSLVPNASSVTVKAPDSSISVPQYIPKDKALQALISLDGTIASTQKIWASMMKFKTALGPRITRKPSQQKLKEHSESITKPFDGDPSVFSELESQLRTLTKMLVKKSQITQEDEEKYFLPVSLIPEKDKKLLTIRNDGKAFKANRTELAAFNTNGALRLEEIQELYLSDPDTFVSRVYIGFPCESCSLDLGEYPTIPRGSVPLSAISFIPKPGDKERVVAVPSAIMQSLSYPIGKIFKTINSSWDVQGVDSHERCCEYISRLVLESKGTKTFYSVDMSNFTDRFPYHGLTSVVTDELVNQGILKPIDKQIMDLVCEGKILLDNQVRSYGVGTPMGTFPSFPAASNGNGMIGAIAFANAHLNGDVTKVRLDRLPMRIIGDDIVIWDDKTFTEYKSLMTRLGVTVQESKCLQSNYVAEMCSKIITDQGVFQQRKIETLYAADDFDAVIDVIRYYGDSVLTYLDPSILNEYGRQIDAMRMVPRPQGLAPELSEPFWSDYPLLYNVYSVIQEARAHILENTSLDARDFDIMAQRTEIYPSSLKFKPKETLQQDPFRRNVVIESLERDVEYHYNIVASPGTSSKERYEACTVIHELCTALDRLTPKGYLAQRELLQDFHLYDRHLVRTKSKTKSYHKSESGLKVAKATKMAIDLSESLINQEKEDDDYGIT
jgi:hypothetical protein